MENDNRNIFVKRTMANNPFYMAPVEIIVPFNGEHASVTRLMESVFKTVHTNRYLLTLVDDGSDNKHFIHQIDKGKLKGVRCFRQDKQKGFGAAINLALSKPFTDDIIWVLIMHSDVYAEDNTNWLSSLGETLNKLKGDGVKMVSPKTNNPVEKFGYLEGSKNEATEDKILRDGYLPLYCALAHRELFKRVGPLRECPYAGVEAEDFAARMNAMGYKQAVCGSSWVHHDGEGTLGRYKRDPRVQEILRKTREDFLAESKKPVADPT